MTVLLVLLTVFVCCSHGFSTQLWQNNWEGDLKFQCPRGQVVSQISSIYDNAYRDRMWDLSCQYVGTERICKTFEWHTLQKTWSFACSTAKNMTVVGMESVFVKDARDRKYRFTCCMYPFINAASCRQTGWLNYYRGYMNLKLDYNEVIIGVYSSFYNNRKDRKWRMTVCKLT